MKKAKKRLGKREVKKPLTSILDQVPKDLPLLIRAYRLAQLASKAGFDWSEITGVIEKMEEEFKELKEAIVSGEKEEIREEIGDLFFVLINISRFLKINPEKAIKRTLDKFIRRFRYIEKSLHRGGKSLLQSNLMEMDRLWEEAKESRIK